MNALLTFILIGITTGAVYGLAALGLVLTYKTSGIFNFAHGAIAAVSPFAFYQLHTVWGVPLLLALAIAVIALPPLMALGMERIARGLANGTTTAKIVATVGLQLGITSALMAHFEKGLIFPQLLPTYGLTLLGVNIGLDQLISLLIAVAGAVGLFFFFRMSSLGVRMRAVVDDPGLLESCGTSAYSVRASAWLIGSWFAAISGVLLTPLIGLDPLLLTLLVVQAYGAAAIGFFSNLPLTFAGGLVIGVLTALVTQLGAASELLYGLPPAMPFLVLFVVLLIVPQRKLAKAGSEGKTPYTRPLVSSRGAVLLSAAAVLVAMVVPFVVGVQMSVYSQALVFVLIFGSLHLLVRSSGQVSLAHAGFVAVGAAAFSHLAVKADVPWLVAVLLAGLVTVPIGALVAIPAIRLSGLYLALATFGFGLLLEYVFYRTSLMFGAQDSVAAPRPAGFESDTAFYYVLLAFVVLGAGALAVIRRSRLGRLLRALAESPTSLITLGVGVNVVRVTVFCVSALLAGIGGALYAAQGHYASGAAFTAFTSLTWLAVLALGGPLGVAAPVMAAIGMIVVPAYFSDPAVNDWLPVLFGIGAVTIAIRESSPARAEAGDARQPADSSTRSRAEARAAGASPVRARSLAAATQQITRATALPPAKVVLRGRAR